MAVLSGALPSGEAASFSLLPHRSRSFTAPLGFFRTPSHTLRVWSALGRTPTFPAKIPGIIVTPESFKMASNGLMFRAGRGPSFILVGLVVVVIILFYSYWGVSSKNNKLLRDVSVLQDRLRVLAARKLTSDKKSSALVTQLTQLQGEKDKVDVDLKTKDSQVSDVKMRLKEKEQELAALLAKEV